MDKEQTALSAYVKLMRAAESVTARLHTHLADHHLTVSQFGVIEALYHLGPLCQRDLAKKLLKSGGNISLVISNLERRKLVCRKRSATDRRYYEVALTAGGRQLIAELFPVHADRIVAEFSSLEIAEQQELQRLCHKLGLGTDANRNIKERKEQ